MTSTAFFLIRLNDHILYLKKIQAALDGKNNFQGLNHRLCSLGKWLYGEGQQEAAAVSNEMLLTFHQLIESHKEFHQAGETALSAYTEGKEDVLKQASTRMHVLSNHLVSILLQMDKIGKNSRSY